MRHWWRIGSGTVPVRLRVLIGICGVVLLAGLYVTCIEPERLVIHRETVFLKRWPPELAGFTIAVLSDFHVPNTAAGEARLRRIVTDTNALNPDLIVLLGDFIGSRYGGDANASPATIAAILRDLHARHGIFCVLGNHDWWSDGEAMTAELEKNGIPVLENECVSVPVDGRRFNLLGLPDLETRRECLKQGVATPDNDDPTIILSHSPDFFAELALPYELMLAGHTHGGQVYIPLIGRPIVPSEYSDRYAAGLIREGDRQLFVTVGTGTSLLRIRFLCPPEIALLTLEPAPAAVGPGPASAQAASTGRRAP